MLNKTSYFFRYMLFSGPDERAAVETSLAHHIHEVANFFSDTNRTGSLFLSGSLARGEPSLAFSGGNAVGLRSDLDWVIVSDSPSSGVDREFENALAARFTGFQDTVYRLPERMMASLRSASTRDLRLGLQCPIVDRGVCKAKDFPAFPLKPVHGLEVIVYYIVAAMGFNRTDNSLCVEGMWTRDGSTAEVKLAVEALRISSISSTSGPIGGTYAAAFKEALDGFTEDIMSFSEVERILRYRERGEESARPVLANLGCIVLRTVARIFGMPLATPEELLIFLRHNLLFTDNILHWFPFLALAALFTKTNLIDLEAMKNVFHADACFQLDPVQLIGEYRWQYMKALLAAKDRGMQLDALT